MNGVRETQDVDPVFLHMSLYETDVSKPCCYANMGVTRPGQLADGGGQVSDNVGRGEQAADEVARRWMAIHAEAPIR